MSDALRTYLNNQAQEFDDCVRQALEITSGCAMAALRSTIVANVFLSEENERLRA